MNKNLSKHLQIDSYFQHQDVVIVNDDVTNMLGMSFLTHFWVVGLLLLKHTMATEVVLE